MGENLPNPTIEHNRSLLASVQLFKRSSIGPKQFSTKEISGYNQSSRTAGGFRRSRLTWASTEGRMVAITTVFPPTRESCSSLRTKSDGRQAWALSRVVLSRTSIFFLELSAPERRCLLVEGHSSSRDEVRAHNHRVRSHLL